MDFIHGRRCSGRTTILLRKSAATGFPILCTHYGKIRILKAYASDMGIKIPEPILWNNNLLNKGLNFKVLIDDAEETINHILKVNSGVICETMVINKPIMHITDCFLSGIDYDYFPKDAIGGQFEFLTADFCGNYVTYEADFIENNVTNEEEHESKSTKKKDCSHCCQCDGR